MVMTFGHNGGDGDEVMHKSPVDRLDLQSQLATGQDDDDDGKGENM